MNSLWLKVVGPDSPAWLTRFPSIVFGTLSIPVAARIGWRIGRPFAIVFAVVFAFDFVFVTYGSEARGYAGLILAAVLAIDALERDDLAFFAIAVAFGTFCHLAMIEATVLVCGTTIARRLHETGWRKDNIRAACRIALAAAAGTLPALAALIVSIASGPMHIGLQTPFSLSSEIDGLIKLTRAVLGWPVQSVELDSAAWQLSALSLLAAATLPMMPPKRRWLPAAGLFGLPILHAVLHLPNQSYARFHLITGIVLALFSVEILVRLWDRRWSTRLVAIILTLTIALGQAQALARFFATGRGHYADATRRMSRDGAATFAVFPTVAAGETAAIVRWYMQRARATSALRPTSNRDFCASPPDWIIVVHHPADRTEIADAKTMYDAPCIGDFEPFSTYPAYGLSGYDWTLWRHIKRPAK